MVPRESLDVAHTGRAGQTVAGLSDRAPTRSRAPVRSRPTAFPERQTEPVKENLPVAVSGRVIPAGEAPTRPPSQWRRRSPRHARSGSGGLPPPCGWRVRPVHRGVLSAGMLLIRPRGEDFHHTRNETDPGQLPRPAPVECEQTPRPERMPPARSERPHAAVASAANALGGCALSPA